jgi:hypothetical protein
MGLHGLLQGYLCLVCIYDIKLFVKIIHELFYQVLSLQYELYQRYLYH